MWGAKGGGCLHYENDSSSTKEHGAISQTFLLPFEHLRIAKGNVMHKILCITWFTLYASVQTEAKKVCMHENRVLVLPNNILMV